MADITMSVDDTLELDALIKESNKPENIINVTDGAEGTDFDLGGIQTHTGIFNPKNTGTYNIEINGQKLKIKVTDPSTVPESGVSRFRFENDLSNEWSDNTSLVNNNGDYISNSYEGDYCIEFDRSGSNEYLDLGTEFVEDVNMDGSTDFSFSFWIYNNIKPSSTNEHYYTILRDKTHIDFGAQSDGGYKVSIKDNSGSFNEIYLPSDSYNTKEWRHMVVTFKSGGEIRLYQNATKVDSKNPQITGIPDKNQSNYFGRATWDNKGYFTGRLDDLRTYSKKLSPTEISNLYSSGYI